MTGLLDYIQIAIGIYMGFYAIRGKGKIYENEFVKEGMEEKYRKTIRLWLAIISPLIIIVGTLGILGYLTAAILAGKGRLRAFREWRGLELQQLALESGLAEARLEQLEAGEILLSRDDAGRLSEALALPIGWLVA